MGFSSVTGLETIMFADNASFNGNYRSGAMTTNGELWIGSTVAPHVRKGVLASAGGTVAITTGAGSINLEAGGAVATIYTADSGSAVPAAGNLNVFGQNASTTPVMDTVGSGATLNIEDRSWQTQYVVDASAVAGLRGTFSTIQAAINQAVTDTTASTTKYANIYIRPGIYAETLTFPSNAGINLIADLDASDVPSNGNVQLSSPQTIGASKLAAFFNISFAELITSNGASSVITYTNCYFTGGYTNSGASAPNFINCLVGGGITISNGQFGSYKSTVTGTLALSGSGTAILNYSSLASITLANTASFIAMYCSFTGSGAISGGSSTTCQLFYCTTQNTNLIAATGNFTVSGLSGGQLYNSSPTILLRDSLQGNIVKSTRSAVSYVVLASDYLIGITSTAAPRTVTLLASPHLDQHFIIKDESGAANTNNITVTVAGGAINIDGATTFVMNVAYGSIEVYWNGSQYFTV